MDTTWALFVAVEVGGGATTRPLCAFPWPQSPAGAGRGSGAEWGVGLRTEPAAARARDRWGDGRQEGGPEARLGGRSNMPGGGGGGSCRAPLPAAPLPSCPLQPTAPTLLADPSCPPGPPLLPLPLPCRRVPRAPAPPPGSPPRPPRGRRRAPAACPPPPRARRAPAARPPRPPPPAAPALPFARRRRDAPRGRWPAGARGRARPPVRGGGGNGNDELWQTLCETIPLGRSVAARAVPLASVPRWAGLWPRCENPVLRCQRCGPQRANGAPVLGRHWLYGLWSRAMEVAVVSWAMEVALRAPLDHEFDQRAGGLFASAELWGEGDIAEDGGRCSRRTLA